MFLFELISILLIIFYILHLFMQYHYFVRLGLL